jgi:cell wall-associated NlpC family hydrolase
MTRPPTILAVCLCLGACLWMAHGAAGAQIGAQTSAQTSAQAQAQVQGAAHVLTQVPVSVQMQAQAQAQTQTQAQMQAQAPAASAAEPSGSDALLQLLQHKGLLAAVESQPRLRQMRDAASDMVMSAMHFLGVPYRRGGNSAASGFDCSGFTRHVFENSIGLVLPRRADEQARDSKLRQVLRDELKPGDLVFFNTMRRAFSHVGIYVGEGKFIHSPRSGSEVRIEDMRQAYWTQRFDGARRPELPAGMPVTATPTPLPAPAAAIAVPVLDLRQP